MPAESQPNRREVSLMLLLLVFVFVFVIPAVAVLWLSDYCYLGQTLGCEPQKLP